MNISNTTSHVVDLSIGWKNISLAPGETKILQFGGEGNRITDIWYLWGDTASLRYDENIAIRHFVSHGENVPPVYQPTVNNILDRNSWIYLGNSTYEYKVPDVEQE